jgi:hypothetical protein
VSKFSRILIIVIVSLVSVAASMANAAAPTFEMLLGQLSDYPHAKQVAFSEQQVVDHEVGLGAIQKVRGEWRFKDSERLTGTLLSYTWQILDGFTSAAVMDELLGSLAKEEDAISLFECKGRACGKGVQWANRIFGERVLYGREDLQQYRVYAFQIERAYRLVGYSAARTADRQYLHVDLIRIDD